MPRTRRNCIVPRTVPGLTQARHVTPAPGSAPRCGAVAHAGAPGASPGRGRPAAGPHWTRSEARLSATEPRPGPGPQAESLRAVRTVTRPGSPMHRLARTESGPRTVSMSESLPLNPASVAAGDRDRRGPAVRDRVPRRVTVGLFLRAGVADCGPAGRTGPLTVAESRPPRDLPVPVPGRRGCRRR